MIRNKLRRSKKGVFELTFYPKRYTLFLEAFNPLQKRWEQLLKSDTKGDLVISQKPDVQVTSRRVVSSQIGTYDLITVIPKNCVTTMLRLNKNPQAVYVLAPKPRDSGVSPVRREKVFPQ